MRSEIQIAGSKDRLSRGRAAHVEQATPRLNYGWRSFPVYSQASARGAGEHGLYVERIELREELSNTRCRSGHHRRGEAGPRDHDVPCRTVHFTLGIAVLGRGIHIFADCHEVRFDAEVGGGALCAKG